MDDQTIINHIVPSIDPYKAEDVVKMDGFKYVYHNTANGELYRVFLEEREDGSISWIGFNRVGEGQISPDKD